MCGRRHRLALSSFHSFWCQITSDTCPKLLNTTYICCGRILLRCQWVLLCRNVRLSGCAHPRSDDHEVGRGRTCPYLSHASDIFFARSKSEQACISRLVKNDILAGGCMHVQFMSNAHVFTAHSTLLMNEKNQVMLPISTQRHLRKHKVYRCSSVSAKLHSFYPAEQNSLRGSSRHI